MAEVQIPMALGNRIIFVKNVKAKPSSHRSRAPSFLRIAPIDSGQQITELGRGDRHRAVGRDRPQEAAPFQPLRKQAGSLAVMPNHLQKIAPASTKAKQLPAQRITSQHLLHLQRQARKALPHVGVTGRQPHPHAARNRDHGRVSSPRMIRSRVSTSMSQSTITRRPFALTISIRPQPGPLPFSGCSATIIAGTNPPMSPSCPSRYALRQANSSWLEIPCRRAVAEASRGPEKLSSTIRSFSAADHRRRGPVSTISRRLIWRVSVTSSIPTISYRPANSTRRPTSDEYEPGANNGGDKRVSTAVAGIVEDVKLTGAPPLRQLPRGIQRAADVVAAVDQDPGNAVQCRCIAQQLVLLEESGVPPVGRD